MLALFPTRRPLPITKPLRKRFGARRPRVPLRNRRLLGGAPQISTPRAFQPPGFSSTGFTGSYSGGSYNVSQTPALAGQVGQLQNTFGQAATAFKNLGATVAPGFSQFRQAGLADLTNQQSAARSNLQDNLAQRRILGSSFASSQQSQQDAEFAAKRDQFIAQSYIQELDASNKLTQEQFQASTSKFTAAINEMNLEGDIAAKLTAGATTALGNIATAQAELDAKNAAGIGSFIGTLGAAGIGAAGNIFRGAGAAGGAGGAGSAGGVTMAATGGEAFLSDAEMAAVLAA